MRESPAPHSVLTFSYRLRSPGVAFRAIRVNDGRRVYSLEQAECVPTLLVLDNTVEEAEQIRIVENRQSGLKADLVFEAVAAILILIPLESQLATLRVRSYIIVWTMEHARTRSTA